jgi:hypothetical protein
MWKNSSEVFRKKIMDAILDKTALRNRSNTPSPGDTRECEEERLGKHVGEVDSW